MKDAFDQKDIDRIISAAKHSVFRACAAHTVSMHFRSMHYKTSDLICDCVVLNLVLNAQITPNSADGIITSVRRKNRALYTMTNSAFVPVEDAFEEYARSVLKDNYDEIKALNMRTANYIVYVMSLDLLGDPRLDKREIFTRAYDFAELNDNKLPHF